MLMSVTCESASGVGGESASVDDDAITAIEKVFAEWGWYSTSYCDDRLVSYGSSNEPYSEFTIARLGRDFTVSVPVPIIGVQYRTTIWEFSEACTFLQRHLEYFMETMSSRPE